MVVPWLRIQTSNMNDGRGINCNVEENTHTENFGDCVSKLIQLELEVEGRQ